MTVRNESEVEERPVSKDELKAGVTAKAGHPIRFLVGGVPGSGTGDDGGGTGDEGGGTGVIDPTGDPGGGTSDPGGGTGDEGGGTSEPGSGSGDEGGGSGDEGGGTADEGGGTADEGGGTADEGGGTADEGGTGSAPPMPGTLELQVVSVKGVPQADLEVELVLPDGTKSAGRTDKEGRYKLDTLPPTGECKLEVPDVPAPAEAAPATQADRVRYKPGLALAIGSRPVVELPPRVRRGLLTGLHFETNKTFLRPSAMAGIRQLRQIYEEFGAITVLVSGHTDTVGDAEYNRGLSNERAESIAAFLTDQVDVWAKNYSPQPHSGAWGVREDQYMLATLPQGGAPYYAGKIDGDAGSGTQAAYKRFQADKGLKQSGRGDADTRKALIKDYMALDGTSLPKEAKALTHGCGLTHLAEPTGPNVANEKNRRAELFLFEGDAAPPPQAKCPKGGCPEYPEWVKQASLTVDLDQPPGSLAVTVTDASTGKPLDGAHVHASGPTADDGAAAGGSITFKDLVPGKYKVIADLEHFEAADVQVDVASGAQASAAVQLKPLPPMKISRFEARALTPAEAKKFKGPS